MAFGGFLKQSTAVEVLIGPFVDDTDGKTAETGLTLAQADIKLSKNGQTLAQKNDATAASHDSDGYYNCELDATDTGTLGQLVLIVHKSGALPVRHEYQIVTANVWDTMCSTDQLDVNVTNIEGSDPTDQIRDAVVDDATQIDASALNTLSGHDPGENIAGASDITGLNDPTAAAIADAVWDETASGHVDAGSFGAQCGTDIDAILADTNELQTDDIPGTLSSMDGKLDTIDEIVDDIVEDTGTTLQAELDGIQADTEDLQTQIGTAGAGLTAVPWNASWDAEVQSECADALTEYDPPTRTELTSDINGLNDPTAAAIADAVWDEESAGHTDAGKAGEQLWTDVDSILEDTNELQTDDVPGLIGALNDFDSANDQVIVQTNNDKTGYALSAAGIDSIIDETLTDLTDNALNAGETITLRKAMRAVFNRFFREVTQTDSAQVVKNDSGDQVASMTVSDDGTTQTKGIAT